MARFFTVLCLASIISFVFSNLYAQQTTTVSSATTAHPPGPPLNKAIRTEHGTEKWGGAPMEVTYYDYGNSRKFEAKVDGNILYGDWEWKLKMYQGKQVWHFCFRFNTSQSSQETCKRDLLIGLVHFDGSPAMKGGG